MDTGDDELWNAVIVTDRDLTTRVLGDASVPADQPAGDVMSPDLCAVGPDAGFHETARVMRERRSSPPRLRRERRPPGDHHRRRSTRITCPTTARGGGRRSSSG